MRTTTILLGLLLAGSAMAFVPSVAATGPCMPEEPCDPPPYQPPTPDCRKVPDPNPMVVVTNDCHVYVTADFMDCLWNEERHTIDIQVVHITYTTCGGPYETMAAAPPCTCPPPQPLCDPVNDMIADRDDAVDWTLSDSCKVTVVVDITKVVSCIFGHDEAVRAGPVTVIYPVCDSPCGGSTCPPPVSAAAVNPFPTCIRECSPLPGEACALRDATPAPLVHPVWGYDCTVDVHTACVGGASGSTDARIGFVDIRLATCSGPAWS